VKCAQYLRVSTAEQRYENQVPELEALVKGRGFDLVATYAEKVSAVKQTRAFDTLMADAHRGKFHVVLVWSLDRLHRSMVGALQTVIGSFFGGQAFQGDYA
jgi:DNA invertase Pin-like site-specific DNA recombinase